MQHGTWTIEEVLSAFLAGEPLKKLCKRVGGSPNTIREVLKEQLGGAKFQAIRDKNDPKKCTATEEELLAAFYMNEAFKDIAARLNTSPNTLRDRWVKAFGKEAFDARSKKFHSAAGVRAGSSWKGKKRVSAETLQARDVDRGVDRRCPVCNVGCVGDQALKNHMSRAEDEAHRLSLEALFKKEEDLKWENLEEGVDYVTCKECGLRGGALTNHLRTHGLDAQSYYIKWPGASIWSAKAFSQHHESLLESSVDQAYNWTIQDLKPFADETGAIIVAKAAIGLKVAQVTILHYCRKLGLSTRNKLAWQRLVLDKIAEVLESDYKWEWSDPRLINSETGRPYNYDGYFPDHNLIVEAHGDQHFRFSENWHGTIEEFHRQREVDVLKKRLAQDLGFKFIVVRQSDPVHDNVFWKALLGGKEHLWENTPEVTKWGRVNQILQELRGGSFPVLIPNEIELKKSITRLKKLVINLDTEQRIRPYNVIGTAACASFFPNRYYAKRKDDRSAYELWHDDSVLRKAIRLQLDSGHPTTPERVLKALVMFSRTPSVFRPAIAKYIYENYCPKGGVVWDPCAGYGGRLLGAVAAEIGKYIATDIEPETVKGNLKLADALGYSSKCHIICANAVDFEPRELLDLVFTSPPYYDIELYGKIFEASLYKSTIDQWVTSFLGSIVAKASANLKFKGFLILNLSSKPVNGLCLDQAIQDLVAKKTNLTFLNSIFMPVRSFKKGIKKEPLLIWQKTETESLVNS